MAEPKIGMKFGTYDTLAKQNSLYYKTYGPSTVIDGASKRTKQIWFDPNEPVNTITGYKTLDIFDLKYPQNEGDLKVMYDSNQSNVLFHHGTKRTENDDIIFEYIKGNNTYARDLNGNGEVDEGEIFKLEQGYWPW